MHGKWNTLKYLLRLFIIKQTVVLLNHWFTGFINGSAPKELLPPRFKYFVDVFVYNYFCTIKCSAE